MAIGRIFGFLEEIYISLRAKRLKNQSSQAGILRLTVQAGQQFLTMLYCLLPKPPAPCC
jgi:hypothetical protein